MVNPQNEDGYIAIPNEIMDHICKIRIPGEARQVFDFIIRKTYGWQKNEDWISLSQFSEGTGLKKSTICKAINKLMRMNLIIKNAITQKGNAITQKGNDYILTYCINKYYQNWNPLPKKVTLPKKVKVITQKGNQPLPKKVTTKDTSTKDTSTKETYVTSFDQFWEIYPRRHGKKKGKAETQKRFFSLKEKDLPLILQAVRNYANSTDVKKGVGIKDPERFLLSRGKEYWREEWMEPEIDPIAERDKKLIQKWGKKGNAN